MTPPVTMTLADESRKVYLGGDGRFYTFYVRRHGPAAARVAGFAASANLEWVYGFLTGLGRSADFQVVSHRSFLAAGGTAD